MDLAKAGRIRGKWPGKSCNFEMMGAGIENKSRLQHRSPVGRQRKAHRVDVAIAMHLDDLPGLAIYRDAWPAGGQDVEVSGLSQDTSRLERPHHPHWRSRRGVQRSADGRANRHGLPLRIVKSRSIPPRLRHAPILGIALPDIVKGDLARGPFPGQVACNGDARAVGHLDPELREQCRLAVAILPLAEPAARSAEESI